MYIIFTNVSSKHAGVCAAQASEETPSLSSQNKIIYSAHFESFQFSLHRHNVLELVEKPAVNLGQVVQLVNAVPSMQRCGHHEHPPVSRVLQLLRWTNHNTSVTKNC